MTGRDGETAQIELTGEVFRQQWSFHDRSWIDGFWSLSCRRFSDIGVNRKEWPKANQNDAALQCAPLGDLQTRSRSRALCMRSSRRDNMQSRPQPLRPWCRQQEADRKSNDDCVKEGKNKINNKSFISFQELFSKAIAIKLKEKAFYNWKKNLVKILAQKNRRSTNKFSFDTLILFWWETKRRGNWRGVNQPLWFIFWCGRHGSVIEKAILLKDFGVTIDYFEHSTRDASKKFNFQCVTRSRDLRAFYHNIPWWPAEVSLALRINLLILHCSRSYFLNLQCWISLLSRHQRLSF
jgi:hypothetical protein